MAEKELSQYPSIVQIGNSTRLAVIESGRNAQAPANVLGAFVGDQIDASGLPSEVEALKAGQQTSAIYADTLAGLQAVVGTYVGQGAFVNNEPGAGQYIWDGAAWQFSRPDVLTQKADRVELDYTNQKIEPIERIGSSLPPFSVLDANGRVLAKLTGQEATVFHYERVADVDAPVPLIVGENGRVIQYMTADASGQDAPYSSPGGIHYPERMRKTQQFRSAREAGLSARLSLAVIGDSWVDVTSFWLSNLAVRLRSRYGDGGVGYVDFGSGTFPRPGISRVVSGWTVNDETVPGPAIYSRSASGAATYSLTVADAPPLAAARLFWIGHNDGVCRYRWDGGDWTTLPLQASGTNFTDLVQVPASVSEYTLDIERVEGTIELCGVDLQSSGPGIVIHKLGNSGSRADDWLGVDAGHWQSGLAGLSPDAVMVLLGTNDRSAGVEADAFAGQIGGLIARVRTAVPATPNLPGPDVMVVVPSQVWRASPMPMDAYRDAILAKAGALDATVTDLIGAVGDPYTRRSWFDADGVHPTADGGGLVVAGRIFESLHS